MDIVLIKLGGIVLAVAVGAFIWWIRPSVNAWIDRLPGGDQ